MKKFKYTDFTEASELIAQMLEKKEVKKALTRSNLCKFWSKIAGKKFAQKSRPYSLMGNGVMVIACENSIVAQELMLMKFQLLEKFKPYLKSLKMNVSDLRFDSKKWII
ncbi:MAG: DUF721 domain-containing protein [Heliobacteriaceae bacterium]|jgi:predicted nucleic acid-binding Zn ribbon protein|nr:DUF721 domain-containing protein [Heliobacteriaceae bacterium]